MPAEQSIDSVHSRDLPYPDFRDRYLRTRRPVVIREAARGWPAAVKWTPEYFRDRFGDMQVSVSYSERMSFRRFIDAVLASTEEQPGPYMYRLFLHEDLPEALPDLIPQNPYCFPGRLASPLMLEYWRRPDGYLKLLIGGVGGGFPVLHFDTENVHATVTEVYGVKDFVMFSPESTAFLYADPDHPNQSRIPNPLAVDLDRFPDFRHATPLVARLWPGDMIFIPCGWWHTARVVTTSISIGTNIVDRSNWAGFVRETTRRKLGVRRGLYFGFATALGAALRALEDLQDIAPGVANALSFPRRLAPASAAALQDPSANPLKISRRTR